MILGLIIFIRSWKAICFLYDWREQILEMKKRATEHRC